MVSCSQDDALQDAVNTDGSVPVTLSATIEHGVQTRATSTTDDEVERCLLQIIEDDGVNTPTKQEMLTMTKGDDGTYSATAMLNPYHTYTFLFWADGGEAYYTAEDLEAVTIAGEDGAGIAWHGKATWSSSESSTIKATLTHAVAKVSLKTTTDVAAGTTIAVTLPTTYTGYNVDTEAVAAQSTGKTTFSYTTTEEVTGTTDGAEIFSFYALVSEETQNLTLQTGDQPEVPIPNVPLAQNKHVILSGDVANAGLTEYTFTATLDENWASSTTEYLEDYTVDADGTYTVYTAKGLQAWASYVNAGHWSTNCTLAADITLPEVEEGESNWTPVGASSNYYSGTFDGAGHTISGLNINHQTANNSNALAALIGNLGNNGTVKNLTVADAVITGITNGFAYVGGIVGYCDGTISGCGFSGSISANTTHSMVSVYAGGIVGFTYGGTITACWSVIESISTEGGRASYVGAIVGSMNASNVRSCYYDYDGKGIGYSSTPGFSDNTVKVENNVTWATAAEKMNEALTDYQWVVNTDSEADDVPLKLVSK